MFQEADAFGHKTGNGSWSGMMGLVSSGVADIGIGDFTMSKERYEAVAFTDTVVFGR